MRSKCPLLLSLVLLNFYPQLLHAAFVGYINSVYAAGYNLVSTPLNFTNNSLSFRFAYVPDGTTISLWNPATTKFDPTSIFTAALGWSQDLTLDPGQGALLWTSSGFTNTFIGVVLEPDGSPFDDGPFRLPPPFSGPTGVYLFSSKFAANNLGGSTLPVFQFILGRGPQEGEQFTWFDPSSQTYQTTTFKSGVWNNSDPVLPVGTSAFFYIYGSPSLRIVASDKEAILSWPTFAPDFILETSSILSSNAIWTPLTNGVVTNGLSFYLTNVPSFPQSFYRLRHQ